MMNYEPFEDENAVKIFNDPKVKQKFRVKQEFPHHNLESKLMNLKDKKKKTKQSLMSAQDFQKLEQFNIYDVPADWEVARNYLEAQKVGFESVEEGKEQKFCVYSGSPI